MDPSQPAHDPMDTSPNAHHSWQQQQWQPDGGVAHQHLEPQHHHQQHHPQQPLLAHQPHAQAVVGAGAAADQGAGFNDASLTTAGTLRLLDLDLAAGSGGGVGGGGPSALHFACRQGRLDQVRLLIEAQGCSPHHRDASGMTPLFVACAAGHVDVAQYLHSCHQADMTAIKTDVPGLPSKNDLASPLLAACRLGSLETVSWLVSQGVKVNCKKRRGASPLFIAAQVGHVEIVSFLLEHGAETEAATEYGATPLYIASQNGHVDVVALLTSYGAEINPLRDGGITPLYIACQHGHCRVVKFLLAHGGNTHLRREGDIGPLYIAVQNGHDEVVALLLRHGVDVDAVTDSGITSLMIACHGGQATSVEHLLEIGRADPNKTGFPLKSFEIACMNKRLRIARTLAAYGSSRVINANFVNPKVYDWVRQQAQWRPLQFAAASRLYALIARRLHEGDDPRSVAPGTPTVLQLASYPTSSVEGADEAPQPVCCQTVCLLHLACQPWSPANHHLHGPRFRRAIFTLLCVAERLRLLAAGRVAVQEAAAAATVLRREPSRTDTAATRQPWAFQDGAQAQAQAFPPLPLLPREVWLHIMSFMQRSHFAQAEQPRVLPPPAAAAPMATD